LVKIWDLFVRIAHWSLVTCVLTAWFTGHGGGRVHEWLGYAALAILLARIAWGFIGPRTARFASFVHAPRFTLDYAKKVLAHKEPRYLGHNPLGAWMIVALIVTAALASLSGWLYTTPQFWGDARMEHIHAFLANALIALVIVHLGGVVFSSLRHKENLVAAMFTGVKRAEMGQEITK
jgi:cytochrome b